MEYVRRTYRERLRAGKRAAGTGSGADGAAVVSALFAADDIESAAHQLRAVVREALGA